MITLGYSIIFFLSFFLGRLEGNSCSSHILWEKGRGELFFLQINSWPFVSILESRLFSPSIFKIWQIHFLLLIFFLYTIIFIVVWLFSSCANIYMVILLAVFFSLVIDMCLFLFRKFLVLLLSRILVPHGEFSNFCIRAYFYFFFLSSILSFLLLL